MAKKRPPTLQEYEAAVMAGIASPEHPTTTAEFTAMAKAWEKEYGVKARRPDNRRGPRKP